MTDTKQTLANFIDGEFVEPSRAAIPTDGRLLPWPNCHLTAPAAIPRSKYRWRLM
jgi:hypothetical protein